MSQRPARLFFVTFLLLGYSLMMQAQDEEFESTNTTDPDVKVNKRKEAPEKKKLVTIIKSDTKGILYGNKCFEEVTHSMGFEYVVQPPGQPGNLNEFDRLWHNLGAKIVILLKNGPFWKIKVNKKRKECKELSGDYVG